MICVNCRKPVPSEAIDPRFCYGCGNPVTQVCPYEDPQEGTRLPLMDDNGHSLLSCSQCSSLFKVCGKCGRLHLLEDTDCRSPSCRGDLKEPSEAFPGANGPLNGTRRGRWGGQWETPLNPKVQDIESFQHLAYRYGLLVGVTVSDLVTMVWENSRWTVCKRRPLPNALGKAHSLLIDDGNAYMLMDGWTYVVDLSGSLSVRHEFPETALMQFKGGQWWVRIDGEERRPHSLLRIMNCSGWEASEIILPVPTAHINDVVIIEDNLVIATRENGLLHVSLGDGIWEEWRHLPKLEWSRLAYDGLLLMALGFDEGGKAKIYALDEHGGTQGLHSLTDGYLHEFAWGQEALYLIRGTLLSALRPTQLSQNPASVNLPQATDEVDAKFLVVQDSGGENRLLATRISPRRLFQVCFINPITGTQSAVGGVLTERPLICIAESRLVIAAREQSGMKLRTFSA